MSGLYEYSLLFVLTYLFEAPIYWLFFRRISAKWYRFLYASLILNLATHPFVALMQPLMTSGLGLDYTQYEIIAETIAPSVETLVLWLFFGFSFRRAFFAAVVANLFSWLAGGWVAEKLFY
jgi:hypothetical protein